MKKITISKKKSVLEEILNDDNPEDRNVSYLIDTAEKAALAAGKYLEAESRIEKRISQNNEFKKKIDLGLKRANEEDISSMVYCREILRPYMELYIRIQKGVLELPDSRILFEKSPKFLEFSDEYMAVKFCESYYPIAVDVKKSLIEPVLKKILNLGKIIPGVKLKSGDREIVIKNIKEMNK